MTDAPSPSSSPRTRPSREIFFPVQDYDLSATLDSGQAFRWQSKEQTWSGVIGTNWVRLTQEDGGIRAVTAMPCDNWQWLRDYLQVDIDLARILKTFPDDEPMNNAVAMCRGLRLLRQDPWECLASFILSSTKQIVQIRQIVGHLCDCFGEEIPTLDAAPAMTFPSVETIAVCTELQLRACKMGFRAPNLLATARHITGGHLDLEHIRKLDYATARSELMTLPGVGAKIANCVLLFGYGFDSAFPVDVWIERALQQLYFPRRRAGEKKLLRFAATHFGPHAGYAQQYLFHFIRTKM